MDVDEPGLLTSRTMYSAKKPGCGAGQSERQCGVYAVEFGLVFLIFFLVLYAVLTYGLIFAAQQSLNHAAEDSARRALAWGANPGVRVTAARDRAKEATAWITDLAGSGSRVDIKVCYYIDGSPDAASYPDKPTCTQSETESEPPNDGDIKVEIRFPYGSTPLIPTLARIGIPDSLYAEATVNLDIALGTVAPQRD